ncbi:sua5 [Holotrichia oblita]|uniref:Sua5 n=2 Tax=Holotrichia oblita TaxID=644536 RepID=A0ACB9T3G3_HOLOL|nr:sua5 [Holotrichia oblita]KAI4461355.1 sua5 [Holotrichia oblita]
MFKPHATVPQISVNNPEAIPFAIETLKLGSVIALPTDTVYGIACCATNVQAVNRLYDIKARNENKPVAICVGQVCDIQKWAQVQHLPNKLLKSLLPGPVTLVLKCAHKLDKSLNFDGKIGIRIPDYKFIQDVCNGLNVPLALTSANLSGDPSSVDICEFKGLWPKLAGILDGGRLGIGDSNRGASTVVDLCEPGYYKIMRDGIASSKTSEILKNFGLKEYI